MHLRIRRPSASMMVAFTALFLVLGGTGFAATTFNDTKQDKKLVKQLAKNLSVKHASTANSAGFANTAATGHDRGQRDKRHKRHRPRRPAGQRLRAGEQDRHQRW
jgi:hypothetical protein